MGTRVKLNNGMEMPIVGLGTWQSPKEKLTQAVRVALDAGYRHIDTAYNYKNEDAIGEVLEEYLKAGKVKREELFIVTKLPGIHMNPRKVRHSLELSLEKLRLDYIDLYLVHSPIGFKCVSDEETFPRDDHGTFLLDSSTDLVAVWKAMEELVDAGLTKAIGLSNFNSAQVDKISQAARIQPVTNEVECHLYFPNSQLVDFCKKMNIITTAFAPIGSPGRPPHLLQDASPNLMEDPTVVDVAKKYNKTPVQILLRALIQKDIVVIPKSVTPERIRQNFQVFDFTLSDEDMQKLDNIKHQERTFKFKFGQGHPEHPFDGGVPF